MKKKIIQFIKSKLKAIIIFICGGIIAIATPQIVNIGQDLLPAEPPVYQIVEWQKPTTDVQWAEDVKVESLDIQFDYQLDSMEQNLTEKLPKQQKDLDEFMQCPECIRYRLKERFANEGLKDKELSDMVEQSFLEELNQKKWEVDKINQSLERIAKEKELRKNGFLEVVNKIEAGDEQRKTIDIKGSRIRSPIGTSYYIDFDCNTPGNGTTATCNGDADDSYGNLDAFTEVARVAGDIAYVRNGTASTTNVSDLNFTSDGTIVAPIQISRDFTNIWAGDTQIPQTATLEFGTTTINFTASTTGIVTGDWLVFGNDATSTYAYEIKSTGTGAEPNANKEQVTLYLPYKGSQTGSGIDVGNIGKAPQWNIAAGDFQWNFDTDNYWKVQGIDIRGTDLNGQVEIDSSVGHQFIDCIFINSDSGGDPSISLKDDQHDFIVIKSRSYAGNFMAGNVSDVFGRSRFYDSLFQPGGGIEYAFIQSLDNFGFYITELYDVNISGGDYGIENSQEGYFYSRNLINLATTPIDNATVLNYQNFEDYQGIIGNNLQWIGGIALDANLILSNSITIRSGGGATSLELRPTTKFGTAWNFSKVQLFEYPIYADTTSKQYDVYFNSTSTIHWTANPTNSELWIECEYWGSSTINQRKLTKSTGTLDFAASTAWQNLSVTCQPAQTGVLYLRGWYAKTKETGADDTNAFFVDVAPVISTP